MGLGLGLGLGLGAIGSMPARCAPAAVTGDGGTSGVRSSAKLMAPGRGELGAAGSLLIA